jgi:hypothetical protein
MLKSIGLAAFLAGATLVAAPGYAQTAQPAKVAETPKGKALVDPKGMTLYTFDRDAAGRRPVTGRWSHGTTAPSSGPIRASRSIPGSRMPSPAMLRATA